MRIILLGSPGAGKGTQAGFICQALGIPQISTGDMLRAEMAKGSPLGLSIRERMDSGRLVDDETVLELVQQRLKEPDVATGHLLDGYPRNLQQVEALFGGGYRPDLVIDIAVQDDTVVKRMSGRRVHPGSGRTYHIEFNPPQHEGLDDVTGEPLVQRPDDEEATVRDRLAIYHAQTRPLTDYLERHAADTQEFRFERVDGTQPVDALRADIGALLEVLRKCA